MLEFCLFADTFCVGLYNHIGLQCLNDTCHYSSERGHDCFEAMVDENHMVKCDVHENDLAEEKESSVRPHNHGMISSQPEKIYSGVKKIGYCMLESFSTKQRSESNGHTASLRF